MSFLYNTYSENIGKLGHLIDIRLVFFDELFLINFKREQGTLSREQGFQMEI
jgi:hypothetical protein